MKEAICDEQLSTPSDEMSIIGTSSRSSSTKTVLPIAECTSTSDGSISDIVKGTRTFTSDFNERKLYVCIYIYKTQLEKILY